MRKSQPAPPLAPPESVRLELPQTPKDRIAWDRVIVFVLAAALIAAIYFLLNPTFQGLRGIGMGYEKAEILEVLKLESAGTQEYRHGQSEAISAEYRAVIRSGKFKGEEVTLTGFFANPAIESRLPEAGDRVLVGTPSDDVVVAQEAEWRYDQFDRSRPMMFLGLAFVAIFIILGRSKGLAALLSLGLTMLALLLNFIPAILVGFPILPATLLLCLFSTFVTLYLVLGAHEKTWVTVIGCFGGVLLAALLATLMQRILHLNGVSGEESFMLYSYNPDKPMDLQGVIFAMILIGSLGAVMDVAMDLASSLYEIKIHAPHIKQYQLFRSGLTIGQDVMGTMANTLILAYAGSSLPTILIQVLYSPTLSATLNEESMIIEVLNSLIGSMGLMLTIPLTAIVGSLIYSGHHRRTTV